MFLSLWTFEILPRQGEQVRFMRLGLSASWCHVPTNPNAVGSHTGSEAEETDEENIASAISGNGWDNFAVSNTHHQPTAFQNCLLGLSPKSVNDVIQHCPNIDTLQVLLPRNTKIDPLQPHPPEPMQTRLITLVSSLANLRHLILKCNSICKVTDGFLIETITHLSLLESFSCPEFTFESQVSGTGTFMKHFAQLSHLKELTLNNGLKVMNGTLANSITSPSLRKLDLNYDDPLDDNMLHVIEDISSFAPNLIELKLELAAYSPNEIRRRAIREQYKPDTNPLHSFHLPMLTRLLLNVPLDCPYYHSFKACPDLQDLSYVRVHSEHWSPLAELICTSTWPKLKIVYLLHGPLGSRFFRRPVRPPLETESEIRAKARLREFGVERSIHFEIWDKARFHKILQGRHASLTWKRKFRSGSSQAWRWRICIVYITQVFFVPFFDWWAQVTCMQGHLILWIFQASLSGTKPRTKYFFSSPLSQLFLLV